MVKIMTTLFFFKEFVLFSGLKLMVKKKKVTLSPGYPGSPGSPAMPCSPYRAHFTQRRLSFANMAKLKESKFNNRRLTSLFSLLLRKII